MKNKNLKLLLTVICMLAAGICYHYSRQTGRTQESGQVLEFSEEDRAFVAWLDELRQVLSGNVDFACKFIAERFEGVRVSRPQGTYMLFLDCTDWCAAHGKTIGELERLGWDVGVAWQDGRMFHGPCHIRMNLALPRSRVEEAFRRLDQHVFNAE